MPDTDRSFREEDPQPDPLLRQPWADDPDQPDGLLRPAWDDLPDETAPLPRPARRRTGALAIDDPAALLAPLAAAQDALARLDARAEAAPAPVRTGLIARLALREAAGWLASRNAWVHPHDLALRTANMAGRYDTAGQIARPDQALPSTLAALQGGWDDPEELSALARAETAAERALGLARLLAALPRKHDPLATVAAAETWLAPLGGENLDPDRFAAWRTASRPAGGSDRKPACPALPPLLATARAAEAWMEAGVMDQPDALVALAVAALLLARTTTLQVVPLPFWAAWPVLGQAEDFPGLPRLRPAVARNLAARERASWPAAFLALVGEAARAGCRELDRLLTTAADGRKLAQGLGRRARLPAALDLVLAAAVVTPRGLAGRLEITLQAANRLLAALEAAGVVREVTGRGSFRAFAA